MFLKLGIFLRLVPVFLFLAAGSIHAADAPESPEKEKKPTITLSEDMGKVMKREAAKVREDLAQQAQSLFKRAPLGWNLETIHFLYRAALSLPHRIPDWTREIMEQSRVLGAVGSLLVIIFIGVLLYSLLGQRKVLLWVEDKVRPLVMRIPAVYHPYFQSGLKVVVSALIPVVLLGLFSLINAMIAYQAVWFQLTGRLLGLWAAGALVLRLLKESLTRDLFQAVTRHGPTLFPRIRLTLLYALIGIAVFRSADVFQIREDVLSLLRLAISVSIVVSLFLLFLKKETFISFFPALPFRSYRALTNFLNNYYYPLLLISFAAALLWCFGYRTLGSLILTKLWFTIAALLAIVLVYHALGERLRKWSEKVDLSDEAAQFFVRSLKSVLLYATVVATVVVVLNLLGLLNPLQRIMSFPILGLGETQVTLWIVLRAILILVTIVYASRLLQAYLQYKVYPSLGIDMGLGYALNTLFKYVSLVIGILISIKIVGIDLRLLLVFAGAIGIGIGFGLQNMAANVISGFIIIFGAKIRKGDWVEVGNTMGKVTDIYLHATKIQTRDNIEYLVPNSNLISSTIVNYSLSSPFIRIDLPVGVSYSSDPRVVERILLEVAEREPLVSKEVRPTVRFTEYADSSLNFELLIWIDVRNVATPVVRSELYFAIFEEFKKAGIEIPFPQRDIHIRSKVE